MTAEWNNAQKAHALYGVEDSAGISSYKIKGAMPRVEQERSLYLALRYEL